MSDADSQRVTQCFADADANTVAIADMRTERVERGCAVSEYDLAVWLCSNGHGLLCIRWSVRRHPPKHGKPHEYRHGSVAISGCNAMGE
jgi:hypothetical protein